MKLSRITLSRVEGKLETAEVTDWNQANTTLLRWSRTAPAGGSYDKCDFTIHWNDGSEYRGRYDLRHTSHGAPDLREHVRSNALFHAGAWRPKHVSEKDYQGMMSAPYMRLLALSDLLDTPFNESPSDERNLDEALYGARAVHAYFVHSCEDGLVRGACWTNDDEDRGVPSTEALWLVEFASIEHMAQKTGGTHLGVSGVEVLVIADGDLVYRDAPQANSQPARPTRSGI